jgi:hypothetical protein
MMGGDRYLSLIGQAGQERLDASRSHICGMAQAIMPDIPSCPIEINTLHPQTILLITNATAQPVQQV